MFFSCFYGKSEAASEWQNAVAAHARWLDLTVHTLTHPLKAEHFYGVVWLVRQRVLTFLPLKKNRDRWICSTNTALNAKQPLEEEINQAENLTAFSYPDHPIIDFDSGHCVLRAIIPPTAAEQVYVARDRRGVMLANDLRLLRRWKSADLNPTAIYALLQFRAVPPALSLYEGIERIPNGHRLCCNLADNSCTYEPFFLPAQEAGRENLNTLSEEDALVRLRSALDASLQTLPQSSVLYYSGGVDSTLLAAVLARRHRHDIQLVNFLFGPEDAEGKVALEIASLLKMPCEQITYPENGLSGMLSRIGREYSYPFGDSSVIPVNLMVHSTLATIDRSKTVIEGIGPDQTFGTKLQDKKWGWAESFAGLRAPAAWAYSSLKLWERESKLGTMSNILRKRSQMPRPYAQIMAINSLDGIAYHIPPAHRTELFHTIQHNIESLGAGLNLADQFNLLNLLHFAIGTVCGKATDLYRLHNVKAVNPYLSREMIQLIFSLPTELRCGNGEAKSLLKKLLCRYIPPELVYRPKKGFDPPFARIAEQPILQEYLQELVLANENPILKFVEKSIVARMAAKMHQGKPLSFDAYRFIWVLLFTSVWLHQQPADL